MPTCLVTGSSGLVGSAVCGYFTRRGFQVHGADNNQRAVFFGPAGDTRGTCSGCNGRCGTFTITRPTSAIARRIAALIAEIRPALIVHAARQPSHDRAAAIPFDDFETNALGTLNLLEAARNHCRESPFVFMSTNKVYGDCPNTHPARRIAVALGL